MSTPQSEAIAKRQRALQRLWFLVDAPMFIDRGQVDRLYDAIFQPDFEAARRTSTSTQEAGREGSLDGGADASVTLLPGFLKFNAKLSASEKDSERQGQSQSDELVAVQSSERRLEKLINLYFYDYGNRLLIGDKLPQFFDSNAKDLTPKQLDELLGKPGVRPIVLLELPPGTQLIPMYGELMDGLAVPLYQYLLDALPGGHEVPSYPSEGSQSFDEAAATYWAALSKVFKTPQAIEVIENHGPAMPPAPSHAEDQTDAQRAERRKERAEMLRQRVPGRYAWLDYRCIVPGEKGTLVPLHLHVVGEGEFPSATYAYKLVRRAFKFGIRVIGTLKTGLDINVLAIYER